MKYFITIKFLKTNLQMLALFVGGIYLVWTVSSSAVT